MWFTFLANVLALVIDQDPNTFDWLVCAFIMNAHFIIDKALKKVLYCNFFQFQSKKERIQRILKPEH